MSFSSTAYRVIICHPKKPSTQVLIIKHSFRDSGGFILPVWVAAVAKAATQALLGKPFNSEQILVVPEQQDPLIVPIASSAVISSGEIAMAIGFCQPGDGLDVTRGLEIWTFAKWIEPQLNHDKEGNSSSETWLQIIPGVGVGVIASTGEISLSQFAKNLLHENLRSLVALERCLQIEIVLPRGKELATRTSNESFGVVDGLALIGTQVQTQVSASPKQLDNAMKQLGECCRQSAFDGFLTFVIGENGFDLARSFGLDSKPIVKVGNWLGPLLVAAAEQGVQNLLLFGYHGKLIKLAGGIFHTHHHLADARVEILTALAVKESFPFDWIERISQSQSIEAAFSWLEEKDSLMARKLWMRVAAVVEERSISYLGRYGSFSMEIGSALFDRHRRVRSLGPRGVSFFNSLGVQPEASLTNFI